VCVSVSDIVAMRACMRAMYVYISYRNPSGFFFSHGNWARVGNGISQDAIVHNLYRMQWTRLFSQTSAYEKLSRGGNGISQGTEMFRIQLFFCLVFFSFFSTHLLSKLARGGNDIRQGAIFVSHKWRLRPIQQLQVLSLKRRVLANSEVRTSVKGET
jgi:hypothetical protein